MAPPPTDGTTKRRVSKHSNKPMDIPDELFPEFCRRISAYGTEERMKVIHTFVGDHPSVSVRQATMRFAEITTRERPDCIPGVKVAKKFGGPCMFYLRPCFYKYLPPLERPVDWEVYALEDEKFYEEEKELHRMNVSFLREDDDTETQSGDDGEETEDATPTVRVLLSDTSHNNNHLNGTPKRRVTSRGNKRMDIPDELFPEFCRRISAYGTGERMKVIHAFVGDHPSISIRQVTMRFAEITTRERPDCIPDVKVVKKHGRAFMFYLRPCFYKYLPPLERPVDWEEYAFEDEKLYQEKKELRRTNVSFLREDDDTETQSGDDREEVLSGTSHNNNHLNSPLVVTHRSNRISSRKTTVTPSPTNREAFQLTQFGFMEIPMTDPSQTLTICMNCRMVPIQFRFPDSYCVGPTSINRIQNHRRTCHTSCLDLTTTAHALDNIIRIEFGNDVHVMQRKSFVNVIRAAVVHDTLVTIFTKNIARLIHQLRGIERDSDMDDDDTDPNVVPPNAWQLFPSIVEFDAVEEALQVFAEDVGNMSFGIEQDYPNFLHFLMMISPGLHATRRFDV